MNGRSEASIEMAHSVGDVSIRVKEVRGELEKEVLAEDSVRDKSAGGVVDKLVDALCNSRISKSEVMFEEPSHGE